MRSRSRVRSRFASTPPAFNMRRQPPSSPTCAQGLSAGSSRTTLFLARDGSRIGPRVRTLPYSPLGKDRTPPKGVTTGGLLGGLATAQRPTSPSMGRKGVALAASRPPPKICCRCRWPTSSCLARRLASSRSSTFSTTSHFRRADGGLDCGRATRTCTEGLLANGRALAGRVRNPTPLLARHMSSSWRASSCMSKQAVDDQKPSS